MTFKAAFAGVRSKLEEQLNVSYGLLNELQRRHVISLAESHTIMVYMHNGLASYHKRY